MSFTARPRTRWEPSARLLRPPFTGERLLRTHDAAKAVTGAQLLRRASLQPSHLGRRDETTNHSIASWGQIFDDPMIAAAMLDRLLHRSVVLQIDGESYRMRAHRARAEALRAAARP